MKTLMDAITHFKCHWRGIFDTLYWDQEKNEYYFARSHYEKQNERVCSESEFQSEVDKLLQRL